MEKNFKKFLFWFFFVTFLFIFYIFYFKHKGSSIYRKVNVVKVIQFDFNELACV